MNANSLATLVAFNEIDVETLTVEDVSLRLWLPMHHDGIQGFIRTARKLYESEVLQAIGIRLSGREGSIIDVGANIGNHSVYFAAVLKRRVHAFEPIPVTFQILSQNMEMNAPKDQFVLSQNAVGATIGKASIAATYERNLGGTSLRPLQDEDEIVLDVTTLDASVRESKVALIKIDVEEMELAVLHGSKEILLRDRPLLSIESKTVRHFDGLRQFLKPLGYTPILSRGDVPTILFDAETAGAESRYDLARGLVANFAEMMRLKSIRKRLERELKAKG